MSEPTAEKEGPSIRRATRADAAELGRLLTPLGYTVTREAVEERWKAWEGDGNLALVVEGEGRLLGVVTLHRMFVLHRPKAVGRITALAVDDAEQGRGLGLALVQAAERVLREAGCGLIEVTSHIRRTEAHAFYRHIGYEQTSFRFAQVFE